MTNVNCICRKIQTPNINVVYETKTSKGLPRTAWHQRQEGAHLADIPATSRFGQLYTRQNLVPIILCVFVLPTFAGVYESFGGDLPGLTKFMMGFSDLLIHWWWLIIIVIVGLVFGFRTLKKSNADFAMGWAKLQLKIPLVGPIIRQSSLARFCRLMSTLTDAGIPIHKAMALARDVVPNLYVRENVQAVLDDVQIGVTIHEAMGKHPVFDAILVSMIRVGEESGMLGDSLRKMADLFEAQTDESTQKLTDMMTPIMTVVIGVVVATLVISMILPMFGMYSLVGGSSSTSK